MERRLKIKCITSGICIIVGIIITILSIKIESASELQAGYMSGFGTSIAVASFILLIKNAMSLKNPKTLREREIELTDERNIEIVTKSMAITFRMCILLQALASVMLVVMNNEIGIYLGLVIGVQLIVYCISSVIVSRKI